MNNLFEISPEEKNRIRNLHESYKIVHGTTSLLKEQQADRTIKGRTLDSKTKKPLLGTNIFVTERPDHKTTADSKAIFELSGIKAGETVSMRYDDNYEVLILDSDKIDDYVGAGMVQFFIKPKEKEKEDQGVGTALKTPTIKGCLDPTAKDFNQEMFENEDLLDCAGVDQRVQVADDSEAGFYFNNPDRPDQDNSCCEYYEGCMDETAKNYWKNDPKLNNLPPITFKAAEAVQFDDHTLKALDDLFPGTDWTPKKGEDKVIPKQIKPCKNCCVYNTIGCMDAAALNFAPQSDKPCLDENEDGRPDCCKYPAGQQSGLEQIKKNFADYYNNKIFAATINLYEDADGRDERDPKELVGNYKVDNETPVPVMKGDNYVGFTIPLLPDSRAIKALEAKLATKLRKRKRRKLEDKLKLLKSNDMGLTVTFGRNTKELLQWVFKASQTAAPPTLKTYLKPRGSNKKGDRVYVGPKEFTQKGLDKLINFLKAYNLMNARVPKTSNTEY